MIHIALVEDEPKSAEALQNVLRQYAKEHQLEIKMDLFADALQFLDQFKANYHIIFFDIEMPYLNGMAAAKKVRRLDSSCVIAFVTSLAQYAISGYQVGAADYFLKPITYASAKFRLQRVFSLVREDSPEIVLKTTGAVVRLNVSQVLYVESYAHRVIYHADNGDYEVWDTISHVEDSLPGDSFSRCNSGYLVNLRHVSTIENNCAVVGQTRLKISERRRKAFTHALMDYIGGVSKAGD